MPGILIADDQEIVRSDIKQMIKEMELGFENIYEAADGVEALDIAAERNPEIILADIMMPKLSGLQFVEELRKNNQFSRVIIVSAHNDFHYARKAININVDDYILKPVNRKELYDVLISAKNKIKHLNDEVRALKEHEKQYYYMLLYEHLSNKDIFIDADRLYENAGIKFENPYYKIGIIWFEDTASDRILSAKKILDEKLRSAEGYFISFFTGSDKLIYIFDCKPPDKYSYDRLIEKCLLEEKVRANCGTSAADDGIRSVREAYRQADEALKESIYRKAVLCTFTDIKKTKKTILEQKDYIRIFELLSRGLKNELDTWTNDLFLTISRENLCFSDVLGTLLDVAVFLYAQLKGTYPGIMDLEALREQLQGSKSIFSMKIVFKNLLEAVYRHIREYNLKHDPNHILDYIIRFIKNNYQKDFTLIEIANKLSMNYSYISSLFAQKAGKSFSEYLTEVRLEKAKELLSKSKDRIYLVAEKSGYPDAKYFCRLFKKRYGMSPAEYRDRYFINN